MLWIRRLDSARYKLGSSANFLTRELSFKANFFPQYIFTFLITTVIIYNLFYFLFLNFVLFLYHLVIYRLFSFFTHYIYIYQIFTTYLITICLEL
jgi:hypothetical protein